MVYQYLFEVWYDSGILELIFYSGMYSGIEEMEQEDQRESGSW